jgi:lipopolysaccharide transport system ATP-binding protein
VVEGVVIEDLWQAYRRKTSRGRRERGHRSQWALRAVSLRAGPGEMVGVVGGNGSGKTTLLRSIEGVLAPTRGSVRTAGTVASLIDLTTGVSRDLTGHEHVLMTGVVLGLTRAQVRARYDEIVAFSELSSEALASPLYTYSAGMVLRLGFALLIQCRPAVVCIDEVLAVGDDAFQRHCLAAVEQMRGGGGCIVMASHDMGLVQEHCSRVIVLDDGAVRFDGSTETALAHYLERAPENEGDF